MLETISFDEAPIDLYCAILNSIRDPFNILDKNFRILWANEAWAKIHQRNLHEMIGKFCYEMFQRRDEPCPECPVKVAFNSGKVCVMERWADLPDGSRRWGEVRAYPVLNKSGNILYSIEIAIDITREKYDVEKQRKYIAPDLPPENRSRG
jgi:PAS domain S-box-containing protein